MRALLPAALAGLVVFAETTANADEESCTRAYEHGQQLRMAKRMSAANEEFATCVAECPAALSTDCRTWMTEIERDMPKITVRVIGSDGCPVERAYLNLDGKPQSFAPNTRTAIDPGRHSLRVTPLGGPTREQLVVVASGDDKNIDALVDMKACAPKPEPQPRRQPEAPGVRTRPTPTLTYIAGGVGIAGLIGFGALGAYGLSQQSDLDSRCKPSCPSDDVDAMRRTYLVADIALAVGVVALVGAAIVYITRPERPAITAWR